MEYSFCNSDRTLRPRGAENYVSRVRQFHQFNFDLKTKHLHSQKMNEDVSIYNPNSTQHCADIGSNMKNCAVTILVQPISVKKRMGRGDAILTYRRRCRFWLSVKIPAWMAYAGEVCLFLNRLKSDVKKEKKNKMKQNGICLLLTRERPPALNHWTNYGPWRPHFVYYKLTWLALALLIAPSLRFYFCV